SDAEHERARTAAVESVQQRCIAGCAEISKADGIVGIAVLCAVENVIRLRSQLQLTIFSHRKYFEQGQVVIGEVGSTNRIAGGDAQGSGGRRREGRGIERRLSIDRSCTR